MNSDTFQMYLQLTCGFSDLLVCAAGVVLGVRFSNRYPKPCRLVFAAMSILFVGWFLPYLLNWSLVAPLSELHARGELWALWYLRIVRAYFWWLVPVTDILHAVAMALLVAAVFVARHPLPSRRPPEDDDGGREVTC
jgi:hypothetical protein